MSGPLQQLLEQALVPVLGHDDTEAWDDQEGAVARLRALAPDAVRLLIDMAAYLADLNSRVHTDMPRKSDALLARFAALERQAETGDDQ